MNRISEGTLDPVLYFVLYLGFPITRTISANFGKRVFRIGISLSVVGRPCLRRSCSPSPKESAIFSQQNRTLTGGVTRLEYHGVVTLMDLSNKKAGLLELAYQQVIRA